MRTLMLIVWGGTAAGLVLWTPEPVALILVLQAAVSCSYLLVLVTRTEAAKDAERRSVAAATAVWHTIDHLIVDTTMDGIGRVVRGWSGLLRRAQGGAVRVHVCAALAAVLVTIGYLLWR